MTRRRPSTTGILVCLVLGVLGSIYAVDWFAGRGTLRLPWAATDLLPPEARDRPQAGYEEAGERLAPPVEVAAPDASYAFQQSHEVDGAQVPVAWSPCRPVHVVVDPADGPADFAAQVQVALDELSAATGLVLAYDGVVAEPDPGGGGDRAAFQPERYGDRWAPVLVAWSDEAGVPGLAGDVLGLAQVHAVTDPYTGDRALVSGAVHLDTDLLDPAYGPTGFHAVLRHELAHVIGLDHVEDPAQLMNAVTGVPTYQAGDLTGLAALGRGACTPGL